MDWKKLAEQAQSLEEEKQKEAAAPKPPPVQPKLGDTVLHPSHGRCVYAGQRDDGQIYLRNASGKFMRFTPTLVRLEPVPGQARTFTMKIGG